MSGAAQAMATQGEAQSGCGGTALSFAGRGMSQPAIAGVPARARAMLQSGLPGPAAIRIATTSATSDRKGRQCIMDRRS